MSSTKAVEVIPALKEIYNNYGRPKVQISDNGPPLNLWMMTKFGNENDIELQKTPPLHPSSNPAETLMRPLGKAMKIAHINKYPEKDNLGQLLDITEIHLTQPQNWPLLPCCSWMTNRHYFLDNQ